MDHINESSKTIDYETLYYKYKNKYINLKNEIKGKNQK